MRCVARRGCTGRGRARRQHDDGSERWSASSTSCVTSRHVWRSRDEDAPQLRAHAHARERVERAERLVHVEHVGARHQRARHLDALEHSARELLREAVLEPREPDQLDVALHQLLALARRALRRAEQQVAAHRHPREHRPALRDQHARAGSARDRRARRRAPRRGRAARSRRACGAASTCRSPTARRSRRTRRRRSRGSRPRARTARPGVERDTTSRRSWIAILTGMVVTPAHRVERLEPAHQHVEQEADHADQHHARRRPGRSAMPALRASMIR